MAKLKIAKTGPSGTLHDKYVSPTIIDGSHFGGTGGLTSQTGSQLAPTVKIGSNSAAAGSILKQKGTHKFQVTDGTNTGTCTLVNLSTPTASNTMSLQINTAQLGFANVAAQGSASTFTYVTYATANVAGPVAPAQGSILTGTGITGTVTIQSISVAGGLANANVSFSSQTVTSQPNTTVYTSVNASRITNKFVYDFGNDGNGNPNKYRYRLAAPDATFVQVASA